MATTTAQKRQELLGLGAVNVNLEKTAMWLGLPAELGPLIHESIQGGIGTVDTMTGTIELKPSWKTGVKQGLRIVDIETQADGSPLAVVVNFPKELKVLFPNVQSRYRVTMRSFSTIQVDKHGRRDHPNPDDEQRYVMGALPIPHPLFRNHWAKYIRYRHYFEGHAERIQHNENMPIKTTRSGRLRIGSKSLNAVEPPFEVRDGEHRELRVLYNADPYLPAWRTTAMDGVSYRTHAELNDRIRSEGTLTVQVTNELINVRNRYFDNDEGVEIVLSLDKRKGILSIHIETVSKPVEVDSRTEYPQTLTPFYKLPLFETGYLWSASGLGFYR